VIRRTTLLVAAVSLIATLFIAKSANAQTYRLDGRFIGHKKVPSCVFRYQDGNIHFSKNEVRETIRCAVARWPVPGGLDTALYIARRESGFNWYANNPTSSAAGVYQWVSGTWSAEVSRFSEMVKLQHMSRSVWNARSNVLIAVRLAHGCGCWAPWGM
jgi:hypothetical protein